MRVILAVTIAVFACSIGVLTAGWQPETATAAPTAQDVAVVSHAPGGAPMPVGTSGMVLTHAMTASGDMDVIARVPALGRNMPPVELRLLLRDGDELAFAVPGQAETLYHLARDGDALLARAETIVFEQIAQID